MVQKYQSPVRVYKYPFELVMAAYERRFPKCPQMPIVLDCQVIKDEEFENGSKRNTSRRCKLAVDAPYLFKKLIGVDHVFFIQHNFLDYRSRTLNIEAVNETFSARIEIFERCRYYAHPDNPDWTCFDQTATLDIKNFFGFENSMEKMGMKQYTQTTLKGKEIIEFFIDQLKSEGITHVDRWPESDEIDDTSEGNASGVDGGRESKRASVTEDLMFDADYIANHLGNLLPMQESKLLELKKQLYDQLGDEHDKMPKYSTLLRFLRARDFNVEKACFQVLEHIQWREQTSSDKILQEYKPPSVITKYFPGGWHRHDREGRPIYVLRLGHMDVKGLLKSVGQDGLLKLAVHICETGLDLIDKATEAEGKPVMNWCLLVDLEGLSMRHLWRPGVKALLNIIETVEHHYPETLGRVLVVRAPRVFPIAWTIVSTFIDENTRSKFLFYGGPDCIHMKDGLEVYIDSEVIPDFLGGPCSTLVHDGGLVPKNLYKSPSEDETNGAPLEIDETHSLYQNVELKSGYIHEVIIKNNDPKSVITWDFDVLKSNLHFSLYRTAKSLTALHDPTASVFELHNYEEDKDYFREEPILICRPKESVQGSHVMNHVGNYVLQWQCPPINDNSVQLMYFYEILSSANYKGSMSSLQSGLSALSLNSSNQSR